MISSPPYISLYSESESRGGNIQVWFWVSSNSLTSVFCNCCYLAAIVLIMNLNCLFIQLPVGQETKEPQNKAKEKNKKKSIWKYSLSRTSHTKRPYSWQFCAAQRLVIFKTWHFPSESHATLWKIFSISCSMLFFKEKGILGFDCFCHVKDLKRLTAVGSAASCSYCKHALLGETGNLYLNRLSIYVSQLHSLVPKSLYWHVHTLKW